MQRRSVRQIVAAIQQHVDGLINESVERRAFRRQPGRELAKTCNFCSDECNKKNLRDQIIEGLLDADTIEQLLKEKDLTLDKAVNTCRAQEAAKKQRAEITNTPREPVEVCALHRPNLPSRPAKLCPGCGSGWHKGGRQQCPAFHITCHTCKKVGHFSRVCRGRQSPSSTPPKPNSPATRAVSTLPLMASTKLSPSSTPEPPPTVELHMSSSTDKPWWRPSLTQVHMRWWTRLAKTVK